MAIKVPKHHAVTANASLYTQFAALVTDASSVLRRTSNRLLGLTPLAAVIADLTAIRTQVVNLVADVTALRSAFNTAITKLNADAGVTDTNYAQASAMTATNPAALTASTTMGISNGTTAGYLKLTGDVDYSIGGTVYRKNAADDVWNLSAQTNTTSGQYRAFWLYLDSSGTASIGAGSNAASADAAVAALPAITSSKAVIGVYVAGASTDFDNASGLTGQGTVYVGWPGEAAVDALDAVSVTLI